MSYDEQTVLRPRVTTGAAVSWTPSGLVLNPTVWSDYATTQPPERLCGTCAHWRPEQPEGEPVFGRCECPRVAYGYLPYRDKDEEPVVTYATPPPDFDAPLSHAPRKTEPPAACADMLLHRDDEGYDAELLIGRDFGCVHWQWKQE